MSKGSGEVLNSNENGSEQVPVSSDSSDEEYAERIRALDNQIALLKAVKEASKKNKIENEDKDALAKLDDEIENL